MLETRKFSVKCDRHGPYEGKEILINGKWRRPPCPQCVKDREANDAGKVAPLAAQARRNLERLSRRSGIPPRYTTRTFDNFRVETDDQRKALDAARSYADAIEDVMESGAGMIMAGRPGTGKTHLACAIGNHFIRHGRSVLYITVPGILRRIRNAYRPDARTTEQEEINALRNIDLLIIDEIGVQKGSDNEERLLFEVINERYGYFKPTILISNLNFEGIRAYLGDRALDRMKEGGGKFILFTWDSYRGQVARDKRLAGSSAATYVRPPTRDDEEDYPVIEV